MTGIFGRKQFFNAGITITSDGVINAGLYCIISNVDCRVAGYFRVAIPRPDVDFQSTFVLRALVLMYSYRVFSCCEP